MYLGPQGDEDTAAMWVLMAAVCTRVRWWVLMGCCMHACEMVVGALGCCMHACEVVGAHGCCMHTCMVVGAHGCCMHMSEVVGAHSSSMHVCEVVGCCMHACKVTCKEWVLLVLCTRVYLVDIILFFFSSATEFLNSLTCEQQNFCLLCERERERERERVRKRE